MIPLSDGIPAKRFPYVNVALIVANFLVWILYELPHLGSSVYHASFYPCSVGGGFFSAHAHGGGTAFFAHVGGFVFGVAAARALLGARQRQDRWWLERRLPQAVRGL